jgi:Domain of unknown function (DU1801)
VKANQASGEVGAFLDGMHHSRRPEIERVRQVILGAGVEITEQVKWNAPSFCSGGDDRVTLRLQPGDRVELILHRGVTKRSDTAGFIFTDPTGLVRWLAPDRGVVVLVDAADTERKLADIMKLVEAWIDATAGQ